MSQDTLSDVLRAVRLRGAVFYYVDGTPPWMVETPAARELIPVIMPGAQHMIEFHGVVKGSCWATIVGEPPRRLDERDVILFPHGDPHVMSSAPGMKPQRKDKEFYSAPRPPQLPHAISLHGPEVTTARLDGGGSDCTTVVCGFLGLDARPFNPLLAGLPRVLHVAGTTLGPDSWVASFLRAAVVESNQRRPGGEAVLERMSEMLFVEVLRSYVDALPAGQTGWLAGMRDHSIGRVLALLHEKPGAPWTLERLADDAAMSRSTLHERFVHFIGQPPMQYLAQWRMQVAAGSCATPRRSSSRWRSASGTRARPRSRARSNARWVSPRVRGGPGVGPAPGPKRSRRDVVVRWLRSTLRGPRRPRSQGHSRRVAALRARSTPAPSFRWRSA